MASHTTIGPENAITAAVAVPQIVPTTTPNGRAKGMNSAKTNNAKIGVVSKLTVLFVTSVMVHSISFMNELPTTTAAPIENANSLAARK